MIATFVKRLEDCTSAKHCDINPLDFVNFELFELLLDVATGKRAFTSPYDRARKVVNIGLSQIYVSTDFMFEIYNRVIEICAYFLEDCSGVPLPLPNSWVKTLLFDHSTSLFSIF